MTPKTTHRRLQKQHGNKIFGLQIFSVKITAMLVVLGFGLQAFICDFSRQNICSVLNENSDSIQKFKLLNPYHFAGQDVSFNARKFLTFFTFLLHFELASIFHQFDTSNFRSAIVDRLSRISQPQVAHSRSRSLISFPNP